MCAKLSEIGAKNWPALEKSELADLNWYVKTLQQDIINEFF